MKKAILIIILAIVGAIPVLSWLERNMVFFPSRYPEGAWSPPGLNFEDAWFSSEDGIKLHGWHMHADSAPAVVLYAHGNGGNLSDRYEILKVLHQALGLTIMIFDYRGYGRSEGSPEGKGVIADARAARTWLASREKINERDIVLLGRSLGGGIMVKLAAETGARGLILESTFSSLPDVASHHYPIIPARLLMRHRFDSEAIIGQYKGPLFQSHGDRDNIVPFIFGKKLFEAASEPKEFVAIPGMDHNTLAPPWYYEKMAAFIGRLQ